MKHPKTPTSHTHGEGGLTVLKNILFGVLEKMQKTISSLIWALGCTNLPRLSNTCPLSFSSESTPAPSWPRTRQGAAYTPVRTATVRRHLQNVRRQLPAGADSFQRRPEPAAPSSPGSFVSGIATRASPIAMPERF